MGLAAAARVRGVAAAVLFSAAAFALAGCGKPKTGDACKADDLDFCESDQLAISCRNGVYAPFVCPAGCTGNGVCNYEKNGVGDACQANDRFGPTRRCRDIASHETKDCKGGGCPGTAGVFCEDGVIKEIPCRGPQGCFSDPSANDLVFSCDLRNGDPGDACLTAMEEGGTCGASNPQQILQCLSGELVVHFTCTTQCVESNNQITCQ